MFRPDSADYPTLEAVMFENTFLKRTPECAVCYGAHDEDIHEATLSVRGWFRQHVMRNLVEMEEVVTEQVA